MTRRILRLMWLPCLLFAGVSAAAEMDFQLTSDSGDNYRAAITIDNPTDRKVVGWVLEFTLDREIVQTFGARMTQLAADRYKFQPSDWTKEIAPGGQAKFTFVGKPGNLRSGPKQVKLDVTYAEAMAAAPSMSAPIPTPEPTAPSQPPAATAKPATPTPKTVPRQGWTERPTTADAVVSAGRPTSGSGIPHTLAFKIRGAWNNGFTAEIAVVNNTDKMVRPWRLEMNLDAKIEDMWEAKFRQIGEGRYVVTPNDYNQDLPPGGFVVFGFKAAEAFRSRPSETKLNEGG